MSRGFSRLMRGFLAGSAVLALFAFCCSPGRAVAEDFSGKVASPDGYRGLISKVQKNGTVRVIVKLKTAFMPEPNLSKADADTQRTSIARVQNQLISGLEAAGHKPSSVHGFKYIPYIAMTIDGGTLDALLASPDVEAIEEDTLSSPVLDLSVPRIGATTLHSQGVTGKGIAVAILDTGVDKNHPFLQGSVVSEACYSSGEGSGGTSVCPGGVASSTAVDSALPYGGSCPSTKCDHGTHVAGIVAGRSGVSGSPGPGVAPEASIIAIQVFTSFGSSVGAYSSDLISGLERVYELRDTYKIASVNMSLGGSTAYSSNCDTDSRKSIIDTLRAAGIASVIASGNNYWCGSISAPACISTAVSVGATDDSDAVASYSNSASLVSVFAPGSSINSSIPLASGGGYASWNGTSMATPHVAGAWALMKQNNSSAAVSDILNAFTSTGLSVTDSGKCPSVTKQRINVNEAYNAFAPTTHQLTATIGGNKKGTVAADGLTCSGDTCGGTYAKGTNVTIVPTADSGSYLDSWTGCDSLSGKNCVLTMNADKAVTAIFAPLPRLTVTIGGNKKGTVAADGLTCSADTCTGIYGKGTNVTIVPTAASGSFFNGWTGCDSVSGNNCIVTMTADKAVTAAFSLPPKIGASPMSVNFGSLKAGAVSSPRFVTIKNSAAKGGGSVTLGAMNITGANAADFAYTDNCPASLARNESCTASVTLTPSAFGVRTALFGINSNDPKKPLLSVKLSGKALPPSISTSPSKVSFGKITTGTASPVKIVKIKNSGLSDLLITSADIEGDTSFKRTGSCGVIAKGGSCDISVTFTPASAGAKNASLKIVSNDPKKGTVLVKLSGTGK